MIQKMTQIISKSKSYFLKYFEKYYEENIGIIIFVDWTDLGFLPCRRFQSLATMEIH